MAETDIVRIQFVEILFDDTLAGQMDLPLNRLPEWATQHEHPVLITRIEWRESDTLRLSGKFHQSGMAHGGA